jgi:hypothetical protein
MTGQELYALYQQAYNELGSTITHGFLLDYWDDLEKDDRTHWNAFAAKLVNKSVVEGFVRVDCLVCGHVQSHPD